MAIKQLSDGGAEGTTMGQSASDLVAFHGETPIAQAALTTLATSATVATAVVSIREIITFLRNKGLAG